MNRGFQYKMATGRATLPVAVILSLAIWLTRINDYYQIAGMAVCGLSTYFLYGLNSAFGIIRVRSYLAPAFYVLIYTAFSFTQDFHDISSIIPLLFIGSLFTIIRGNESYSPQIDVFHSFFCAGLACMTDNEMIYAVPVLFICMLILRSMNLRCFLAALLGFIVPYWILSGYYVYIDKMNELPDMIREYFNIGFMDYGNIGIKHWIYNGAVFLIFASSGLTSRKISLNDKVKNRSILKCLNITCIYIFIIIALVPSTATLLLPVIMIVTSILFGYVMTQLFNKATLIIMIISLILIFGIAGYNLLMFNN